MKSGAARLRPFRGTSRSVGLAGLHDVHRVDDTMRARLKLTYPDADGMDAGEQDLVAYALASSTEDWAICSPDKASVRAAVRLGLGDSVCSLEELADLVGSRPAQDLRRQFTSAWLRSFRTSVILDTP